MHIDVATAELRLGMFIVRFEGSWWNHPFWRSAFLLRRQSDLDKIRDSGVERVTIDLAQGLGPAPASDTPGAVMDGGVAPPPDEPAAAMAAAGSHDPPKPAKHPHRRKDDPLVDAAETVQRSKAAITRMFGEARLGHAVRSADVEPLVDEIASSVKRDPSAMIKVCSLKTKDEYTYLHSVAVCALMINLARTMRLDEAQTRDIGMAGLLHDIGKMAVPDSVLDKPGRLSDAEFALVRGHPAAGHKLLAASTGVSAIALDVCLHHHERVDGTGYPFGFTAEELSIHARMGAVCDVYDAVTSNRCYKPAWAPTDALSQMSGWAGHFDPEVLTAFTRSIGIFPVGTLVRISGGRLGIVYAGNDEDPTRPVVRTFYDVERHAMLQPGDLRTGDEQGAGLIVGLERGERWFGGYWPEVSRHVLAGQRAPTYADMPAAQIAA